jgi:hypothetical protein
LDVAPLADERSLSQLQAEQRRWDAIAAKHLSDTPHELGVRLVTITDFSPDSITEIPHP